MHSFTPLKVSANSAGNSFEMRDKHGPHTSCVGFVYTCCAGEELEEFGLKGVLSCSFPFR